VLVALLTMDRAAIHRAAPAAKAKGQVREGFRAILGDPVLRIAFAVLVVVSTLSFNYNVAIPTLVKRAFGGGSGQFGLMLAVSSVGSLLGALVVASRPPQVRMVLVACAGLGASMAAAAWSPTLWLSMLFAIPMGLAGSGLVAITSGLLVNRVAPNLRGRVLALQATVFLGSTPIGSPIVGFAAEHFGSRWGLGIGGIAALVMAPLGWVAWRHSVVKSRQD
jgi:MFS family permease